MIDKEQIGVSSVRLDIDLYALVISCYEIDILCQNNHCCQWLTRYVNEKRTDFVRINQSVLLTHSLLVYTLPTRNDVAK